jgi:hypothetical protein
VNVEPARSPQSPPVTDNHLQGDGGPSEPLWMAFGGRPPTPPLFPTAAPNPEGIPIDPALTNTTLEIPPPIPHLQSFSSTFPPTPLPNPPIVSTNATPVRVASLTPDRPGSVASITPPHSEAHAFTSDTPGPVSLSQDIPLPASGTPGSHPSIPSDPPSSGPQTATAATPRTSSPPPAGEDMMDVQTRPYTAPRNQPTLPNLPGRGRGGRGRGGRGRGRGRGGGRGGQRGGGLGAEGEGGGQNDENIPAGDPDVVQIQPLTSAQRRQIAAYNKMLKNVTPNLDGLYPLANFGPPPSDSEPALGSKRSRKASKLGDGSAAYLVPSAEELQEAEEARKEKAAQRALKRGGNVPATGRAAKRYVENAPTVQFDT